ncbi:hypothetical protein SEVIR_8G164100v4 [Setaria viridis]|uniref:BSD domain-containing protein n=1 Tax=Setaria viridis TaxID=4556 RepID=A0A4U6TG19_SETVI|nr:uncharacterized protein LOC117833787 [Setaria viridis]TKW01200.1 hypothetical protein SEVIR_8G164100v2 [Setaria viridis]
MAWLARSIANSLLAPEEQESSGTGPGPSASPGSSSSPPRGVREDLSEFTGALANRFQGLASFLAPAAPGGGAPRRPDPAEIAGRFRAGLARLPGRQAVADLAKIASSLLPPEGGDADWAESAVGVTEEVVAFARDAALRHELWLDFPLLPDDADSDDFDMTDAQQDHALAVESVAPELADLRIELCPSHMSEGCFWKIYFVLLHPKLMKEDADILSTPQILEARGKLSHDLRYQTKIQSSNEDTVPVPFSNVDGALASPVEVLSTLKGQDGSVMATSFSNIDYGISQPTNQEFLSANAISDAGTVSSDNISSSVPVQLVPILKDATVESQSTVEESTRDLSTGDATTEEQSMQMSEIALVDNSPPKDDQQKQHLADISEQSRVDIRKAYHDEDDDGDEWLEEETGGPGSTAIPIADDEDVSFSDLEDDDGTK